MADSKEPKIEARHRTWKQRLRRYITIFVVAHILLALVIRGLIWHTQWKIEQLGGSTVTGPPPLYSKLAYTNQVAEPIRAMCASSAGRWLFSQWPVIYAVDLRGVDDPKAVAEALLIAQDLDHVLELVLYQSAVQDEHLKLVGAGFRKLKALKINETAIGDAGIAALAGKSTLLHINAQRTNITDLSIPHFCQISRLRELNLGETKVTSIKLLKQTIPRCYCTLEVIDRSRTTDQIRVGN